MVKLSRRSRAEENCENLLVEYTLKSSRFFQRLLIRLQFSFWVSGPLGG
jgi:hypothetical protein